MWPLKYISILVLIFIILGDEYALYLIPLVNETVALPSPIPSFSWPENYISVSHSMILQIKLTPYSGAVLEFYDFAKSLKQVITAPLPSVWQQIWLAPVLGDIIKTGIPCLSRFDTLKNLRCLMTISAEHKSKFEAIWISIWGENSRVGQTKSKRLHGIF